MNSRMLKPTILSISLLTIMAAAAVSPALPEISLAFPDVDQTMIRLILALPALVVVPFSLLSGWLASKMSKKIILYVALGIYVLGGAGGGLAKSIASLLMIRAFLGIGIGLIMPLSTTLIMDFFEGKARTKMLGLQASVNQLGGMIFLALSGWLSMISWRYAFCVYFLGVISFFFILIWLPKPPKKEIQKKTKVKLNAGIFRLAGIGLLMMIAFFVVNTDLGLFIQNDRQLFTNPGPLFENKEEFLIHLEKGTVSEFTRIAFKNKGITLSENASLQEIEPDQEWRIVDGTKKFNIRKEGGELTINAGLGTPVMAGYALSTVTLGGIIAGITLSFVIGLVGSFIVPVSTLLMAVGYGILGSASSLWMVFLSMLCIGLAGGLMTPPLMLRIPKIVSANARTLAVAVVSSAILFGQFLSPLVMKLVVTISKYDSFRFRFNFLAVALAIGSLIGIILAIRGRMKSKKLEIQQA